MVKIKTNGTIYDYPDKVLDNSIIDKHLREDVKKFFKKHKIKKSTFLEELYKEILFLDRMGRLKESNYVVSINLKQLGMRRFRKD
jgi:hypothetical protein